MAKLLLLITLTFFTSLLRAQSVSKTVVAASGDKHSNATNSVSFTIGEPIVGAISNNETIEQGFWAGALLVESITSVADLNGIVVYPNPVLEELHIVTEGNQVYGITLFSVTGQKSMQRKVESSLVEHSINLSTLSRGVYILQLLVENSDEEKLFKIIKE